MQKKRVEGGRGVVHERNEWNAVVDACEESLIALIDPIHLLQSAIICSVAGKRIRSIMISQG